VVVGGRGWSGGEVAAVVAPSLFKLASAAWLPAPLARVGV